MALHGVTMPLVVLGREAVMMRLLLELGLAQEAVLEFFTGPALTRRMLARARELGMRPVLPGFGGHDQLQELFPSEPFSRLPLWSGFSAEFSGLLFVEPASDLYVRLGKRFIEIQTEMACGHAQLAALRGADPEAIWVVQGWLFVNSRAFWGEEQIEAYLHPVPREHILVLDLISEAHPAYSSTRSYHGRPFLWSVLHNFGGQVGLRGNLRTVMDRPYAAARQAEGTMVGIGLTMEAINQNPVVYELALDHVWNPEPRDLGQWLRTWVRARYGYLEATMDEVSESFVGQCSDGPEEEIAKGESERCLASTDAQTAWQLLLRSCYSAMDQQGNGFWGVPRSVIEKRPSMRVGAVVTTGFQGTAVRYDACELVEAWLHLEQAVEKATSASADLTGSALELDLVELTRQALANHAQALYLDFVKQALATEASVDALEAARAQFLQLLGDLDALLAAAAAASPRAAGHFSAGAWLGGAEALASGQAERQQYAHNARNLLTLWGPHPAGTLADYTRACGQASLPLITGRAGRSPWTPWLRRCASAEAPA
ncbi:unnamed protein product [Prorocentrum cordatum]|uniref:Alpha-N-acetylglucosaminidase n=1 Tax=Prorocentrum cordatum TaxID=2364126 RepID=A0ABN9WUM8_9DINO|nr:unnamed protein product [Polarella glacialis]